MALKLIQTKDGSHTLYDDVLDEIYHSHHGAIAESMHVFIKNGLVQAIEAFAAINILEVGLGTGLNVLLTALHMRDYPQTEVNYMSTEPFPPSQKLLDSLNFAEQLNAPEGEELFKAIHSEGWELGVNISKEVKLHKTRTGVHALPMSKYKFHLIYFDAFAPAKAPELWTPEIFLKLYDMMASGGALVTYCAQGQFKRDLKSAGFVVEDLPGPPGKRSMTRGIKQ